MLICLLSSCARVTIRDAEVCGDAGSLGAACFHTLTEETREVSLQEWEKERFGMLCTRADNFAHWKATILKLCKIAKRRCTYDAKRSIVEFGDRVEDFSEWTKQLPEYSPIENKTIATEVEFKSFDETEEL